MVTKMGSEKDLGLGLRKEILMEMLMDSKMVILTDLLSQLLDNPLYSDTGTVLRLHVSEVGQAFWCSSLERGNKKPALGGLGIVSLDYGNHTAICGVCQHLMLHHRLDTDLCAVWPH